MSKKNTAENKALRREARGTYKGPVDGLKDYYQFIQQILPPLEDGVEDTRVARVKLVPLDKALSMTRSFVKVGEQFYPLNPKWSLLNG